VKLSTLRKALPRRASLNRVMNCSSDNYAGPGNGMPQAIKG
jgi:hypothetical protein